MSDKMIPKVFAYQSLVNQLGELALGKLGKCPGECRFAWDFMRLFPAADSP